MHDDQKFPCTVIVFDPRMYMIQKKEKAVQYDRDPPFVSQVSSARNRCRYNADPQNT